MSNRFQLITKVLDASKSTLWDEAVMEWEITDWDEAEQYGEHSCICGKENIIKLYTISNIHNGNILFPIGSQCIKKFDREELSDEISAIEKMFSLQKAYENNEFIELSPALFSKKSLKYMYDNGAFNNSNYGSGYNSYQFILKMYKKRNTPSPAQQRKINAIIMNDIRPYCYKLMIEKSK